MLLLDTNVLSELRKINVGKGDARVKTWAEHVDPNTLFISVVSVLELQVGTELMERRDARQGAALRFALEQQVLPAFAGRVLSIDLAVTRRCASLHVPDPRPYRDSFIAATALVHGMTVVTRNCAHFVAMDVAVFNPWQVMV
jgi:predicted nucleic acid-binding protein